MDYTECTAESNMVPSRDESTLYHQVRAYIERLCRNGFLYIHLEPTNHCNTTCVMCPRGAMVRAPKLMRWETFEAVMAVVLPTDLPMVSLVGFGEPTLHRQLATMIGYIRSRRPDMIIKLTTNGSRLAPAYIDSLYLQGLDLIEISVVGTTPGSYALNMGGLELESVLNAIRYLNSRNLLYTLTTFVTDGLSPNALRQLWLRWGARTVEVKGFHTRGSYLDLDHRLSKDSLGEYKKLTRDRAGEEQDPVTDACHKVNLFLHVNADGNFIPCVQEINNKNILFNISEVTSYVQIIEIMRSARPVFDICSGCELKHQDLVDYYARFFVNYFPLRIIEIMESQSS